MSVPPDIDLKLRLTLREGSVYYFVERSLTSAEPHYFIVVNFEPLTQQVLLLSVVTSKVAEVKRRRSDSLETIEMLMSNTDLTRFEVPIWHLNCIDFIA